MSTNLFLHNSFAVSCRVTCTALVIYSLSTVTLPTTTCAGEVRNSNQKNYITPKSRFPAGMEHAPTPDDSETARSAAIKRLNSAPRREVCPGYDKKNPHLLGTTCGTREFDAPPILETPKLQWVNKPGWWGAWDFSIFDNKLYTYGCERAGYGLAAFDLKAGKRSWLSREVCEKLVSNKAPASRPFLISDKSLLLFSGRNTLLIDKNNGKLLQQDTTTVDWHTLEQFDSKFVSTGKKKDENSFLIARSPDLKQILWKNDSFLSKCAKGIAESDCPQPFFSRFAYSEGILFVSAPPKDAAEAPHRQLHALDIKTGKTLWVHTDQPYVREFYAKPGIWKKSDDTSPMVADNKVIIRVEGFISKESFSYAYRAFDTKTGREIWTTPAIPGSFSEEWLPHGRFAQRGQSVELHLVTGDLLITTVSGGEPGHRELWAFRLKDGSPAWRRDIFEKKDFYPMTLAASAGGALYLASQNKVMALEAATGTKLWEYIQPNMDDENWMQIEHSYESQTPLAKKSGEFTWDNRWVIGPDGGFYGTFAPGVFKISN